MGVETIAAIVTAVTAATGAAVSYEESRKRNSQAEAYQEEVEIQEARQRRIASTQAEQAAAARREQRLAEAQQVRSQIQAAAAESGVGVGGTFEAMMRQVNVDAERNLQNLSASLANELQGIQLNQTVFQSQQRDPWMESAVGGVGGAAQGLQLGVTAGQTWGKE